jgi:transposase-like protein
MKHTARSMLARLNLQSLTHTTGGKNEHLAAGSAEALAARQAEQAETQRLKRENKRLEEEIEILRKAAAFFARGIA